MFQVWTPYRKLTNGELLSLLSQQATQSPIIAELCLRIEEELDLSDVPNTTKERDPNKDYDTITFDGSCPTCLAKLDVTIHLENTVVEIEQLSLATVEVKPGSFS